MWIFHELFLWPSRPQSAGLHLLLYGRELFSNINPTDSHYVFKAHYWSWYSSYIQMSLVLRSLENGTLLFLRKIRGGKTKLQTYHGSLTPTALGCSQVCSTALPCPRLSRLSQPFAAFQGQLYKRTWPHHPAWSYP